jgi:hypothetical protein
MSSDHTTLSTINNASQTDGTDEGNMGQTADELLEKAANAYEMAQRRYGLANERVKTFELENNWDGMGRKNKGGSSSD